MITSSQITEVLREVVETNSIEAVISMISRCNEGIAQSAVPEDCVILHFLSKAIESIGLVKFGDDFIKMMREKVDFRYGVAVIV